MDYKEIYLDFVLASYTIMSQRQLLGFQIKYLKLKCRNHKHL